MELLEVFKLVSVALKDIKKGDKFMLVNSSGEIDLGIEGQIVNTAQGDVYVDDKDGILKVKIKSAMDNVSPKKIIRMGKSNGDPISDEELKSFREFLAGKWIGVETSFKIGE